jgi:DNA-binding winged helix-turn-helix (wHTH) protein
MDEVKGGPVIRIGSVTLNTARGCLRGADGAEIALAPKPFDLLVILARNTGRTLSKDALLDAVWPGVHVTEDSLFQAVREARRAIGDEVGQLLRSVPRRGYLLDVAATPEPAPRPDAAPAGTPLDRPALAVLPFANLSSDAEQEYFSDGITDEVINQLSRARWFYVSARNSGFTYKGRAVDARQVGCASRASWSMPKPVTSSGSSASTARWTTSSNCRIALRKPWPAPSSRACSTPRSGVPSPSRQTV